MFFSPYATKYTRELYAKSTGNLYGGGSLSESERRKIHPSRDDNNRKWPASRDARRRASEREGFPINAIPNSKMSARLDLRIRSTPVDKLEPLRYQNPGSLNPRKKV